MSSTCPVCRKPHGWFDRISQSVMCRDCFEARATLLPVVLPEEPEEHIEAETVIQIPCREPFSEQVRFGSEHAQELHRRIWPWWIREVLSFFPLVLPLAILSAFYSFSGKVVLLGFALWFANYLFGLLCLQLDRVYRAKYLGRLLGEEWVCEIAADTVAVKRTGQHSVFLNRYLTGIEDNDQCVILHYGDFGRLRIPFPSATTEIQRCTLVRKIRKRPDDR